MRSEQVRIANTLAEFQRDLAANLCYQRGTTAESASAQDAYWTLASSILDRDEYLVLADYRSYIDCHDRASGRPGLMKTGGPGCPS